MANESDQTATKQQVKATVVHEMATARTTKGAATPSQ